MRPAARWLSLLVLLALSGCWLTGTEVDRKVEQHEATDVPTGDTSVP